MSTRIQAGPRARSRLRPIRWLQVTHRWVGVIMCLFFAMWFVSGVIMIYVPFPFLGEGARLARVETIDSRQVQISPGAAVSAVGASSVDRLRLIEAAGRALYVITPAGGAQVAVSAETGTRIDGLSAADAATIAERFSGSRSTGVVGPFDYDQWAVHHRFDRYRPLYRVDLDDQAQTSLYVSSRSGEVIQRTTRFERAWNWVGAVAHWIYPTVLRRDWALWDRTVWYLSLVGVFVAVAGLTLGTIRWNAASRTARGGVSPFRGWLRWHHIGGLVTGVFVTTWIVSGWLSMDHGRLFSTGEATTEQIASYRGISVPQAAAGITPAMMRSTGPAAEIEVVALAGEPFIVARGGGGEPRIHAAAAAPLPPPVSSFPATIVAAAVRGAWPSVVVGEAIPVPRDDHYARLRSSDGVGGDALRVMLDDSSGTRVYVDPITSRIIEVIDASRRAYRWLYYGLHTLDFPFLASNAVWTPLMLVLLAGGTAFSVTGVAIGWRRLQRKTQLAR